MLYSTTFDNIAFLKTLENPSTISQFFINLQTLIHNGEYSYMNSLSLFQHLFPKVKTPKGVRRMIIVKYKDEELAEKLYILLTSSKKTDCSFLQQIDIIMMPYL